MTKEELMVRARHINDFGSGGAESIHMELDRLLLEYIDIDELTEIYFDKGHDRDCLYGSTKFWYA